MSRLFAAFALAFILAPLAHSQDAKKDLDLLQGDWKRVKMETGGKEDDVGASFNVRIKGDKLMLVQGADVVKTGDIRFKLDPSTDPMLIELAFPDGKVFEGIYKLEKNRWTMCIRTDTSVKNRPVAFETKGESTLVLVVLERME